MMPRSSIGSIAFAFTIVFVASWTGAGGCGGRTLMPGIPGGGAGAAGGGSGDSGVAGTGAGPGAAGDTGGAGNAGSGGVAGATVGTAGSTGTGGATTGAGGRVGATGTAGQGGAGGAQACGPCANPTCKDGYMSVVDPAVSCCPICRLIDCSQVLCPAPTCSSGSHAETPKGKCCPVCVKGPSQVCNDAQVSYDNIRTSSLVKYGAESCRIDTDCALVFEDNACESNCGEALTTQTADFFTSNLQMLALACDGACPALARPPCPQLIAVCSNGLCTAVPGTIQ